MRFSSTGTQGFSIGVSDVTPSELLDLKKRDLIGRHYKKCDEFIAEYKAGRLIPQPGCNEEQTLEVRYKVDHDVDCNAG